MNSKPLVLASTLVLVALPSFAHDTFLLPREPQVRESSRLTVDLTSGMSFPNLDTGIAANRIAKGAWRTPTTKGKLDRYEEESQSLVMHMTPRGDGTAVLFLTLKPKTIELTDDQVEEYFDEIGASESLRREWESREGDQPYKETYVKHCKSFVRVGDEGDDATCRRPVGQAVEIIPQRDPTMLSAGDSLVVKVVRGGDDEIESFPVTIVCGNSGDAEMYRTNQNGMVALPVTEGGWWMIRCTELRRRSNGTFESDFSTMTFYVGEN